MDYFQIYLICINIIAFLLVLIDFKIYEEDGEGIKPYALIHIATIGFGALGILLATLILDRHYIKINKKAEGKIIWLIYYFVFFLVQAIIVLILYGPHNEEVISKIVYFYDNNKLLIIYLIAINIITFIVYGIDKWKACNYKARISILMLLVLALVGGSIGAFIALGLFKHKINKQYFVIGIPLILLAQIAVIIYLKVSNIL